MKKSLLTLLIVLFATAVYADNVTFSISGDGWERGDYIRNQNFLDKVTNTASYGALSPTYFNGPVKTATDTSQLFYDGGFFLYPKLTMDNDKVEVNMKLAILKQDWDSGNANLPETDTSKNSGIFVERAYITYHFTENSTLDVGLQEGGAWGSTFSDMETNMYRIVYSQKTSVGLLGGLIEKSAEVGNNPDKPDNNTNDATDYALFAITKAGNVWVKPLIYYINMSSGISGNAAIMPVKLTYLALELNGDLGPVSFDSEFGYKGYNFTDKTQQETLSGTTFKDVNVWGAYVNVFKALDTAKPGLTLVYDSWDKNGGARLAGGKTYGWGFDSGNDFKSNLIFGGKGVNNENPVSVPLGQNAAAIDYVDGQDLMAFTMIKPYIVDIKTPITNLTASASVSYMSSNQKDTMWDGAKAYEVDLGVAYQLSKNLVYSIGAGYGKCDLSNTGKNIAYITKNPDAILAVQHMIKLTF